MSRCLTDQELVALRYEGGTLDRLAHLKACPSCSGRHRVLAGDLAVIDRALRSAPPSGAVARRAVRQPWRRAAAAAAVAAVILLGEIGLWRMSVRLTRPDWSPADTEVVQFLDDVSSALFEDGPRDAVTSQLIADLGEGVFPETATDQAPGRDD
jgi:hypothetical protein